MRAAVALVSERGTTNITISDLAEAADVSRQLVYQQFGDRDTLLLEAALDLAGRELVPAITTTPGTLPEPDRALAAARHFAAHRPFYRAMFTGPCAYGLNVALSGLLSPFNQGLVRRMAGTGAAPELLADCTAFVTGGWAAVINTWVIEGAEPLDVEDFTDRLMRMLSVVTREKEHLR
ncbi:MULTISPECIES: TetR/AcrR family transcriptional regulator [unclassified Streptomyces]|uniref:TetR/AcrR family transcriptional regulator n=1 Tax=unclassified Streptomyces TaxID=2593676 RepID=UPI002E285004|nr:helix-turn-helix domain-containing protein [Streptomyces sp. NBC_01429]